MNEIKKAIKIYDNSPNEHIQILVDCAKELTSDKGLDYQINRAIIAENTIKKITLSGIKQLNGVL